MIPYHRVAGRFFNRPLFLADDAAEAISSFLLSRMSPSAAGRGGHSEDDASTTMQGLPGSQRPDGSYEWQSPRASRFYGDYPVEVDEQGNKRMLPYRRTPDGVGIISIVGELVNRGAWVGASSGLVSYEALAYQLSKAAADPKVHSILLDIESPGGEAVGVFEIAAKVRAVAAEKHVTALVNGMAASAGYGIVSGASRIVTLPTGISGSIGCVMLHLDFSEFLKAEGIKPTFIYAGEHKVDGNPYEKLDPAVLKRQQAKVDQFYQSFLQAVAEGRGTRLTAEMARATQARVYLGDEAVKLGLADETGTFEEVLADLSRRGASSRSSPSKSKGITMSEKNGAPATKEYAGEALLGEQGTNISLTDHAAAVAKARSEGIVEGRKAAHERLSAVIGMEGVKGREMAALDLAMKAPDMSAEDVASFVSQHSKPSTGSNLAERMAANSANNLRPDGNGSAQKETKSIDADTIYAKMNGVTG